LRLLLVATVILFPLSYALKYVYDLQFTWIDPSFLTALAALVLLLLRRRFEARVSKAEAAVAVGAGVFLSAYLLAGLVSLVHNTGSCSQIAPTPYACLREPIRLLLSMTIFYLVLLAAA
jgi:hypothetical protein